MVEGYFVFLVNNSIELDVYVVGNCFWNLVKVGFDVYFKVCISFFNGLFGFVDGFFNSFF